MDPAFSDLADRAACSIGSRSIACAESFTAGVISQTLAAAQQSSEWFCGGVVAYQVDTKRSVLGVTAEQIVSADAAVQMAEGVAQLLGADIGVSSTGVAGPEDQDGIPAGTVVIGWTIGGDTGSETLEFDGSDPEQVVLDGARAALERVCSMLEDGADD